MSDSFLTVTQAKQSILDPIKPITETEQVPIRQALNRVLACDILSPINVPAHDNSAMDGYALNGASLQTEETVSLQIVGTAMAGTPYCGSVQAGQCVRIMTGAVMPEGCDTVVIQESVSTHGQTIEFEPTSVNTGENCRKMGEDLTCGQAALKAGKTLTPADLGLLASLGVPEVPVRRKIRVAFFSTGDELRSLGQPLDAGCVYDSNRYTLFGMLNRLNFVEAIDLGVVPDNPAALEVAMQQAANQADAIITSGGVSVGEADHTKAIMARLGDVNFWKIAMRPGRPMAYGQIRRSQSVTQATLFGLPGNPVAVMITFYAFVREALHRLSGAHCEPLPSVQVRLNGNVRKKPGRTEYQRVKLNWQSSGWVATLTGAQGSGVLRSMSESDGLLVLEHEQTSLRAGDMAWVIPFHGLI